MLKLSKILKVIMELVENSGSTLPPSNSGRKGSFSIHDRLTTQCEKQNVSDLKECNQTNFLHNISMSTITDIAKFLVNLSELSVLNRTQEYPPATSKCLHICSLCQ